MRYLMLLTLPALAGCANFTRAQLDLVEQTRRGIELVSQDDAQRGRAAAELAKLRRQRLDEAFDEDVRVRATQESLDPDWVIEARNAYAVALDAYAKAQAADEQASQQRARNLSAMNSALDRLRWMLSVQLKVHALPEEATHERD